MTTRRDTRWLKILIGGISTVLIPTVGWGAAKAVGYVVETRTELAAHESLSDHPGTAIRFKYIEESLQRLEAQQSQIYQILASPK